jgi:hypothetical protein
VKPIEHLETKKGVSEKQNYKINELEINNKSADTVLGYGLDNRGSWV